MPYIFFCAIIVSSSKNYLCDRTRMTYNSNWRFRFSSFIPWASVQCADVGMNIDRTFYSNSEWNQSANIFSSFLSFVIASLKYKWTPFVCRLNTKLNLSHSHHMLEEKWRVRIYLFPFLFFSFYSSNSLFSVPVFEKYSTHSAWNFRGYHTRIYSQRHHQTRCEAKPPASRWIKLWQYEIDMCV